VPVKARQPLATSGEVAEYLGVSVRTLDDWAHRGVGPEYSSIGRYRRYRWSDVDKHVDEKRVGADA
jgi:excisionase family DNA binding protein